MRGNAVGVVPVEYADSTSKGDSNETRSTRKGTRKLVQGKPIRGFLFLFFGWIMESFRKDGKSFKRLTKIVISEFFKQWK
jgi:hypothetical protein